MTEKPWNLDHTTTVEEQCLVSLQLALPGAHLGTGTRKGPREGSPIDSQFTGSRRGQREIVTHQFWKHKRDQYTRGSVGQDRIGPELGKATGHGRGGTAELLTHVSESPRGSLCQAAGSSWMRRLPDSERWNLMTENRRNEVTT